MVTMERFLKLRAVKRNQGREHKIRVSEDGHRCSLDQLIQTLTGKKTALLLQDGAFFSGSTPLSLDASVSCGQEIVYRRRAWVEPAIPAEVQIIHCDDSLLVVEKPAGVPMTPSGDFYCNSLVHRLREALNEKDLSPIHRLDIETSGVLIFSRKRSERGTLQRQFQSGNIQKIYHALVFGHFDPRVKRLHGRFEKGQSRRIFSKWGAVSSGGKKCVTEVLSVQHGKVASLLHLKPLTGRTNQLRAQLSDAGHPIVGDKKYHCDEEVYLDWIEHRNIQRLIHKLLLPTQALHAWSVTIQHPVTQDRCQFTSAMDLPDRFPGAAGIFPQFQRLDP